MGCCIFTAKRTSRENTEKIFMCSLHRARIFREKECKANKINLREFFKAFHVHAKRASPENLCYMHSVGKLFNFYPSLALPQRVSSFKEPFRIFFERYLTAGHWSN